MHRGTHINAPHLELRVGHTTVFIPHAALDGRQRRRDRGRVDDDVLRRTGQLGAARGFMRVVRGRELGADGRDDVFQVAGFGDQGPVGGEVGADGRGAGFDAGPHYDAGFVVCWGLACVRGKERGVGKGRGRGGKEKRERRKHTVQLRRLILERVQRQVFRRVCQSRRT